MDAKEIKEYLSEDRSLIEKVLEEYGFHDIWYSGSNLRCASPTNDNNTSISIKMQKELPAASYSSGLPFSGDLFGLLAEFSDESFKATIKRIHSILGIRYDGVKSKKPKIDLLGDLRKYKKSYAQRSLDIENEKHDKSILERFIPLPHIDLLNECISAKVCSQYSVGYDNKKERIIFPHFDWIDNESVVGITGRTTMESFIAKELGVPKYWNYIKGYKKTHNLYGYAQGKESIKDKKMVVIFEAEKSVLKLATIEKGYGYGVSVGGHEISNSQVDFILKHTDPMTEVVIAFDKDVMTMKDKEGNEIGEQYLKDQCAKFTPYRKASYIIDKLNTIDEKDSPIDKGVLVWNFLLSERKEYKDE